MARPRKDPALKALKGTLRKDREPKALAATGVAGIAGPMVAPFPLMARALEHFDRIAGLLEAEGRASPHFAYTVALLAQRLEEMEVLSVAIAAEGHTKESRSVKKVDGKDVETVMLRARPEVAMRSETSRQIQSLLSELMLSPTAAQRLGKVERPKGNAFAEL